MKVVLTKDVAHVGRQGEVVEVANGYGINYLIPKKLALKADSPEGQSYVNQVTKSKSDKAEVDSALASEISALSGQQLTLPVQVNEAGTLFASLNDDKVAESIASMTKVKLSGKNIKLTDGAIKEVGEYTAKLMANNEELGEVMLNVEAAK